MEVADEGVQRARKTAESIEITAVTKIDRVAYTLIESSKNAALLAVGTRGHGDTVGALLGSVAFAVSHGAIHSAPCPVAVVRTTTAR